MIIFCVFLLLKNSVMKDLIMEASQTVLCCHAEEVIYTVNQMNEKDIIPSAVQNLFI